MALMSVRNVTLARLGSSQRPRRKIYFLVAALTVSMVLHRGAVVSFVIGSNNQFKQPNAGKLSDSPWKAPLLPSRRVICSLDAEKSTSAASPAVQNKTETSLGEGNDHPFEVSKEKFLQRLSEMRQRAKDGEELTQAYCDAMLGLCVAADEWDSVLDVLDMMKNQGLTQERSSYRACLQACFEVGNGASAREILAAMNTALVTPEPSDISMVVAAMCRNEKTESGWWRRGLSLLISTAKEAGTDEKLVVPVDAYDAVLSCMVEERQWTEAVRLIRAMENRGASNKKSPDGGGLHPAPQVSTYRSVIECCVAANQAEQAVQVLYSMNDRGLKPTVYSFELVLSSLAKRLQWRRALQLLQFMEDLEVPRTVVTYNTVISACARARQVGTAKSLLIKMRKEGIRPNVISFNSVISACASTSRWKDALNILDQCYREPGVSPDIYTYTNAMRACAKGGKTSRALSLLQVVKDKGLPLDSYCYTAVIDACAKAKMWKKALSLLSEMQEAGISPTEVTYSVAISACGNGGQWRKSLDLLNLMREKGMSVNLITYNAAITALSKASRRNARHSAKQHAGKPYLDDSFSEYSDDEGLWTEAMVLFEKMKEDGIEPDGYTFSSAISCCGAEGRWKEALELMDRMKMGEPRTRPNKIAYTAAITACGRAGEGKTALKLFRTMKDEGLSPDSVAYNALFSALRVAGEAETTYELWGEICGTRSTNTTKIATARDTATPDIITLTNCVATLSRAERLKEMDEVFAEAVQRGIVFRGLDSEWETDLSGMSFPVARAACRYIVRRVIEQYENGAKLEDITMITGVGRAQQQRQDVSNSKTTKNYADVSKGVGIESLRDYVQVVLTTEFEPSIESNVPKMAQGTVVIPKVSLKEWIQAQGKT